MAVTLNHTIVAARDRRAAAEFVSELLGLPAPKSFGPFLVVELDNGVSLDFVQAGDDDEIHSQHYAFLVGEEDFDAAFGRLQERGIEYFADPMGRRAGEINTHDGGRGCYFSEPDSGHWLEIITRPYGSGT